MPKASIESRAPHISNFLFEFSVISFSEQATARVFALGTCCSEVSWVSAPTFWSYYSGSEFLKRWVFFRNFVDFFF